MARQLVVNEGYTWERLGAVFGFKPNLFSVGGGMLSVKGGPLLLITHPGGAKSFDYDDRWDGPDLIYTGRGKKGDQVLEGPNRDVAENRRTLEVFEAAGPKRLRYLGEATARDVWVARAPDADGEERNVFKYRLRFASSQRPPRSISPVTAAVSTPPARRPRPFRPGDTARTFQLHPSRTTPEERLALQEKASGAHQHVLNALAQHLAEKGWTDIYEIPSAYDLAARKPLSGPRVIFEVKTIEDNEVVQMRAALSQLLEYRHYWGADEDQLCVVVNKPISDRRATFLKACGVGLWYLNEAGSFTPVGGQ